MEHIIEVSVSDGKLRYAPVVNRGEIVVWRFKDELAKKLEDQEIRFEVESTGEPFIEEPARVGEIRKRISREFKGASVEVHIAGTGLAGNGGICVKIEDPP